MAQKIVVDTVSTNKYIIKRAPVVEAPPQEAKKEDLNFGDRALSIGQGILNRLKARLNLEEASESLKAKKEKYLGKKEEEEPKKKESEDN
ncbi:MAG: hypothetical protein ABJP45_01820 [Cyclobacteriaceae bacterium]